MNYWKPSLLFGLSLDDLHTMDVETAGSGVGDADQHLSVACSRCRDVDDVIAGLLIESRDGGPCSSVVSTLVDCTLERA